MDVSKTPLLYPKDILPVIDADSRRTHVYYFLRSLYKRGNFDNKNLLDGKNNVPDGLTSELVWDLKNSNTCCFIDANHFNYLKEEFAGLPYCNEKLPETENLLSISQGDEHNHITSPNLNSTLIPPPLSCDLLWLDHLDKHEIKGKTVNPIKLSEEMINQFYKDTEIIISKDIIEFLRFEIKRTKVTPKKLISIYKDSLLKDITRIDILEWISGKKSKGIGSQIGSVINAWKQLPSRTLYEVTQNKPPPRTSRTFTKKSDRVKVEITEELRDLLVWHKNRTNIPLLHFLQFINKTQTKPEGITAVWLSRLINGNIRITNKDKIVFILHKLAELPDAKK